MSVAALRDNSGEPIDGTGPLCPRCKVIMKARSQNFNRRANDYARRIDALAAHHHRIQLPIEVLAVLVQFFDDAVREIAEP